jgi:lipopolysaccharide export LptBFGC system permease protein LptF
VNKIAYKGIANRKSYILLTVVILLLSTFLVNYRVISSYGQQSTINSTADQLNPSIESQDKGKLLATPEPAANDLNTVEGEQSGTVDDGSKVKATETQEKQNNADEVTRNSVKDDNGDSNEVSGTSQSNEPGEDDDQNRGDDNQNNDNNQNNDDNQNRDDDQNNDNRQDSESENDDENDDESEENDTPLDFEATTGLPFP